MPSRRRTQETQAEPFTPVEPWWRRSARRDRHARRGAGPDGTTFQVALPTTAARQPVARSGVRLSRRSAAALVLAVALLAALAFLITTEHLAVTRASTTIQGIERITADEIYAASQLEGVNIFQVHAGRVAA
ncbi:MAG: hypothetical protein N2439_13500, partial [Anaerolineae bacterium]|nr:hypothetical protein [Anaerolineae bacterium]